MSILMALRHKAPILVPVADDDEGDCLLIGEAL